MENDITPSPRRTNFLLRQVVIPTWLQVIVLIALLGAFINLLVTNPFMLFVMLGMSVMVSVAVIAPLRRHAGQGTRATDKAEVNAAPNPGTALSIIWRQYRTYQVWRLILVIMATALVLVGAVLPTP